MPSSTDITYGFKIMNWGRQYGASIDQIKELRLEVVSAINNYQQLQTAGAVGRIHRAGEALQACADRALADPPAGVPGFDTPHRAALHAFAEAGEKIAKYDPTSATTVTGFNAARLLDEAVNLDVEAHDFTANLTARLIP